MEKPLEIQFSNRTGLPLRLFWISHLLPGEDDDGAGWKSIVVNDGIDGDRLYTFWRGGSHYFVAEIGGRSPTERRVIGWVDSEWGLSDA